MDLYYNPISAYSHKVLMALYEKEVPFKPILVSLTDVDQKAQYRTLYPLGKLPCLRVSGELIGESSNIVEWLDNHYQVNKLIPEKPEQARQVRYWDRIADQYITQNAILLFFQSLKPEAKQDADRIATARRQIAAAYDLLEGHLSPASESVMVQLSLADVSLVCGLAVSQGFIALDQHPKLTGVFNSLAARASFVRATEGFVEAVEDMARQRQSAA